MPHGSALAAWFSLGGDQGGHVFQLKSPSLQRVPCWDGARRQLSPRAVADGLTYDPFSDTYRCAAGYPLRWSGTCRVLRMAFVSGTVVHARYLIK